MSENNVIKSFVTKQFLIEIITRDIQIMDAILELVDNSLDRAISKHNFDITKSLTEDYLINANGSGEINIDLKISKEEFSIEDNSGGISKQLMENEVFVFGNPKQNDYMGLSAFGIGMKRAFFKLGKWIELRTKTEEDGEVGLIWDVEKWLNEENWNLQFAELSDQTIMFSKDVIGTIIKITQLNEVVRKRFEQVDFQEQLKKRLSTSYALFLKSGVKINLNGTPLTHSLPSFFTSEEINFTSKSMKFKEEVDVNIIAGITPYDDRNPRGWYVFCNGRMVLEADKTNLTGWGNGTTFHPKFNHFVGYVSFSSKNVQLLPWSSTKWGVEADSPIYIEVLEEMRILAKPILDVLDRWKEIKDEDMPEVITLKELLSEGKETPVFSSAKNENNFEYKPKENKPERTRITFLKEKSLVIKVKEALGDKKMSNPSMGSLIFDYYVTNEVSNG